MKRFIFLTLAIMAWAFWELSGGSDFTPERTPEPMQPASANENTAPTPMQSTDTPAAEEAETDTRRALEDALSQLDDTQTITPDDAPTSAAPQDTPVTPAPRPEALADTSPPSSDTPPPDASVPQSADTGLAPLDLRVLDATRVNLRAGPSTNFRAIDQLSQGTVVEVLQTDTSGQEPWVRLIVPVTGMEGWIAERFLIRQ